MERLAVISSNLKSIGYEAHTQTLEVEFTDRKIYQYTRVPKHIYVSLMGANSKGSYFAKSIKDNRDYGCVQVYPIYRQLR